jgi:hypothetical protein
MLGSKDEQDSRCLQDTIEEKANFTGDAWFKG